MNYLNIKINSYDYRKLNNEDKLRVIKTKLNYLFEKTNGKTITTFYRGKRITIPYEKKNLYKELCNREKALEKKVNIDFEYDFEKREKKRLFDNIWFDIPNNDNKSIENSKDENLCSVWDGAFSKRKSTLNKKPCGVLNVNDVFDMFNDKKDNINIDNKSDNKKKKGLLAGLIALPFVKKITDKFKNNKKINNPIGDEYRRKRNIKVAAVALGLAAATVVSSFVPGMFKKKNDSNKNNTKATSYVEDNTDVCEPTINDNEIVEETEKNVEENVDNVNSIDSTSEKENVNYTISFDDKVTIKDNSYIYSSSYDAVNENNYMTPFFDESYEREVMGVVYNLDGNIYTIYSTDSNAYEKADELISKGAKEEAVLVTRSDLVYTGQYEGYYNIEDVNVKTLTRNR